jgi:hypothetical protein
VVLQPLDEKGAFAAARLTELASVVADLMK